MSRLIDADSLKESFRKQTVNVQGKIKDDADAIIEAICKDVDLAPTVDAVQVVRCSKCVHYVEWTAYEKTHCGFQHDGMCKYWNCISTNKNSFCDHGIRITDGYCVDGESD